MKKEGPSGVLISLFFPFTPLLCSFRRNMWSFSVSLLAETKRAVSCCWILLLHPVLILIWSDSPKSLRHLGGHRQDCSSWHWHNNLRPVQPIAVWLNTRLAHTQLEENHLKCYVTSGDFINSLCTLTPLILTAWIPKLQLNDVFKHRKTGLSHAYCLCY